MKVMIISDIHGNIENLNTCLDIFRKEKCDRLFILGDLFNYGIDYHKFQIIEKLNSCCGLISAVRGNCDSDIDINNIMFGMPNLNTVMFNDKKVLLTHGHLYSKEYLSSLDCDIVLTGHTHVPKIEKINNKVFINPGSISKSRAGEKSFAILDDNKITINSLDNNVIIEYNIQKNIT